MVAMEILHDKILLWGHALHSYVRVLFFQVDNVRGTTNVILEAIQLCVACLNPGLGISFTVLLVWECDCKVKCKSGNETSV